MNKPHKVDYYYCCWPLVKITVIQPKYSKCCCTRVC